MAGNNFHSFSVNAQTHFCYFSFYPLLSIKSMFVGKKTLFSR